MDFDQFVMRVQETGRLDSREQAEATTRTVIRLLAERLAPDEGSQLVTQLPRELEQEIARTTGVGVIKFSMNEFLERVEEETGVAGRAKAATRARAVTRVLADSVSTEEVGGLVSQLPKSLEDLTRPNDP
ncbi:MAG: DUF2267 domain-containing protein [Actinomycetota bacterium]|nr:DUF2267 domain-containing protein [Actinomycetota bacterium]